MSTKIQINSLAALERLIGGDSEMEIEIRNSIVQEFGKKHLRALIDPLRNYYYSELSGLIANEVKEAIYKEYNSINNNTLNTSTKEHIKAQVAIAVDKEIWSKSMEKINEIADNIESEITKYLTDKGVETIVNDRVRKIVREKFNI